MNEIKPQLTIGAIIELNVRPILFSIFGIAALYLFEIVILDLPSVTFYFHAIACFIIMYFTWLIMTMQSHLAVDRNSFSRVKRVLEQNFYSYTREFQEAENSKASSLVITNTGLSNLLCPITIFVFWSEDFGLSIFFPLFMRRKLRFLLNKNSIKVEN